MRKWKRICHSNKRQTRRPPKIQFLKNEAGVTLVELLAAIAILGIVIALAGSVHIFGQRQFRSQTKSANQANDLSHALTVISTDLRRYAANQVSVKDNVIEVGNNEYKMVKSGLKSELKLNDSVLIDYVKNFTAEPIYDSQGFSQGIHIEIQIDSTAAGVEAKSYQTTIYFRAESPETTAGSEPND